MIRFHLVKFRLVQTECTTKCTLRNVNGYHGNHITVYFRGNAIIYIIKMFINTFKFTTFTSSMNETLAYSSKEKLFFI